MLREFACRRTHQCRTNGEVNGLAHRGADHAPGQTDLPRRLASTGLDETTDRPRVTRRALAIAIRMCGRVVTLVTCTTFGTDKHSRHATARQTTDPGTDHGDDLDRGLDRARADRPQQRTRILQSSSHPPNSHATRPPMFMNDAALPPTHSRARPRLISSRE